MLVAGLVSGSPAAYAAELTATPATLGPVFAGAQGGDVIRLAAGDYGTFSGATKPSTVTLTPQLGAAVSMSVNFTRAANVRLDGLTVTGATISGATGIAIVNSRFTGSTVIRTASNAAANIVLDGNTFAGINAGTSGYEGRVEVVGDNGSGGTNGVVIQNSTFGPGGCSDGVQLTGGASGTRILNNEFRDIKQGSCNPWHVDPIQFYGGSNTLISGNYFHGNSTGIMSPDGNGSPMTVRNNVFVTDGEYPQQIVIGGGSGDAIIHNTFANDAQVRIGKINVGSSTNETVKDNIITGGFWFSESQSTTSFAIDYNLVDGAGGGVHGINGLPTYVGGAAPTQFARFLLTAGSKGAKAASDKTDMGIEDGTAPVGAGGVPGAPAGGAPGAAPVAGSPAGTGPVTGVPAVTARAVAPRIAIRTPLVGRRFMNAVTMLAAAGRGQRLRRVEFWIDARRLRTDSRAPYRYHWRVPSTLRSGPHTITVRATGQNGLVSSAAVTVRRVRAHRRSPVAAPRRGWRVTVVPSSARTLVHGNGPAHGRVVVMLARCSDRSGVTVARVALAASKRGTAGGGSNLSGLCPTRLVPVA